MALDDGVVREPGTTEGLVEAQPQALSQSRPASRERRTEDVGQVARSLAYMTSLVTTLVGRMDRVEQAQSRNGSSASGRRTTTATSARMETPMGGTPEAGTAGWVDLNSLGERMSQLTVTELARAGPNERPLATMDSIMAGTFSSDDSETARLRTTAAGRAGAWSSWGLAGAASGTLGASHADRKSLWNVYRAVPRRAAGCLRDSYAVAKYVYGVSAAGSATSEYDSDIRSSYCAVIGNAIRICSSYHAVIGNAVGICSSYNTVVGNAVGICSFYNAVIGSAFRICPVNHAVTRNTV